MVSASALKIASLGMYDPPELQAADDALRTAVAARLIDLGVKGAPERLIHGAPLDAIWTDPALGEVD